MSTRSREAAPTRTRREARDLAMHLMERVEAAGTSLTLVDDSERRAASDVVATARELFKEARRGVTEVEDHSERPRRGRPAQVSAATLEAVTMPMLLHGGEASARLDLLVVESGVAKTTILRTFPSFASIVWARFDELLPVLVERLLWLPHGRGEPGMGVAQVLNAIVESTRITVRSDPWWNERLAILRSCPSVRVGRRDDWGRMWRHHVAVGLARVHGRELDDILVQATAGALWQTFWSTLNTRSSHGGDGPLADVANELASDLEHALPVVADVFDTHL